MLSPSEDWRVIVPDELNFYAAKTDASDCNRVRALIESLSCLSKRIMSACFRPGNCGERIPEPA
jgi:hypothetical protein